MAAQMVSSRTRSTREEFSAILAHCAPIFVRIFLSALFNVDGGRYVSCRIFELFQRRQYFG